jgi:hypothetical protein
MIAVAVAALLASYLIIQVVLGKLTLHGSNGA